MSRFADYKSVKIRENAISDLKETKYRFLVQRLNAARMIDQLGHKTYQMKTY